MTNSKVYQSFLLHIFSINFFFSKANDLNEENNEYINSEGLEKLFSQLSIELSDVYIFFFTTFFFFIQIEKNVSFVVMYHLKAKHFGELTKEEFISGMNELG